MSDWDPPVKLDAYDVSPPFVTIFPVTNKASSQKQDMNPQDTYYSMRFTQSAKTNVVSSVRDSMANTFLRFGSYLGLILRFISYVLGAYQRFTLDNSMTKKLFNYVNEAEEEVCFKPKVPESEHEFKNNLLCEARDRRKPFKYTLSRFFMKKNFATPWCCCCRSKDTPEDKLQGKARTRLYAELDILQII